MMYLLHIYKSMNVSLLLTNFKGDEEILLNMIDAFEQALENLINPIRESIYNQNADQLRISAHTLKGIMRSFYAEEASKMASELELKGRHTDFDGAYEILNKFENQLTIFLYELQFLKKDSNQIS